MRLFLSLLAWRRDDINLSIVGDKMRIMADYYDKYLIHSAHVVVCAV